MKNLILVIIFVNKNLKKHLNFNVRIKSVIGIHMIFVYKIIIQEN